MIKLLLFSFLLLALPFIIRPGFAQQICPTTVGADIPKSTGGLLSAPEIVGIDNPTGNCVLDTPSKVDTSAAIILKAQSYDELYKAFFTNSRFSPKPTPAPTPIAGANTFPDYFSTDHVYYYQGDVNVTDPIKVISPGGVLVVFVDGNLNIQKNLYFPSPTNPNKTGLVFIVQGEIRIGLSNPSTPADSSNVTRVDAVLISFGTICTAYNFRAIPPACILPTTRLSSSLNLTVNGSLISLGNGNIQLVRNLTNNPGAAESINNQAKYLLNLAVSDLMDSDLIIPYEGQ